MGDCPKPGELARSLAGADRDADEVQQCLELAAALGPDVSFEEWQAAGRQLGLACDQDLLDALVHDGIAQSDDEEWHFVDSDLIDELARSSTRNGRWERQRAACAQALYDVHPVQSPAVAARRVVHLLEAGKKNEALEPLLLAEQHYYDRGYYGRAEEMLDEYEQILDEQGVPEDDEERGRSLWRRGRLLFSQGALDEAVANSEAAERLLEDGQYPSERGQAALFAGRILRDAGEVACARQKLKVAVESFAAAGDERGLALSRAGLGMVLLLEGEAKEALGLFRRAKTFFQESRSTHLVASVLIYMAQAWHYLGDRLQAMSCIEQARDVAQANDDILNEAGTWNFEGEIARDNGDWGYARRCYRRSARLYAQIGSTSEHIAYFNQALVEIGAEEYESADDILSEVEADYAEVGFGARLPLVYAARIVAMAGVEDYERLEQSIEKLEEALHETGVVHFDILEQLERALTMLATSEHDEARERLETIAEKQRSALE